jgi:hypothetical protein
MKLASTFIDWCPHARIHNLMSFIDEVWKPGHILSKDKNLLKWQYQHPVLKDHLSVLIATEEDSILGMLGVIFHQFNDRGARLPAAMLATWVVRKDKRAAGLGLRLLNTLHSSGVKVIGCIGANPKTTVPICSAYGYAFLDSLPRFVKIFNLDALTTLLASTNPSKDSEQLFDPSSAKHNSAYFPSYPQGFNVTHWNSDAESAWDECWVERLAPNMRSFDKDASYIIRRFLSHPLFNYQILVAWDSLGYCQGLLAYRIERVKDRFEKILHVCELLATSHLSARALLAKVCRNAATESVCLATCHTTHAAAGHWLVDAGFQQEIIEAPLAPSLFQPLEFRRHSFNGLLWLDSGREKARATIADPDFYWVRSDGDQDRHN